METFLSAVILAGGKSSRMGQDKALIIIDGVPLLRRIATIAQACSDRVYIITPWSERYQPIIPKGCQLIREILPSGETKPHGPLMGFAQALRYGAYKPWNSIRGTAPHLKTEWVLLLACDLPNLNQDEVRSWLNYLNEIPRKAIALLPRHAKGWEPLCGFYRPSCLRSIEDFISKGGRSFQQWLASQYVCELPINDLKVLFNCNTPADLASLQ